MWSDSYTFALFFGEGAHLFWTKLRLTLRKPARLEPYHWWSEVTLFFVNEEKKNECWQRKNRSEGFGLWKRSGRISCYPPTSILLLPRIHHWAAWAHPCKCLLGAWSLGQVLTRGVIQIDIKPLLFCSLQLETKQAGLSKSSQSRSTLTVHPQESASGEYLLVRQRTTGGSRQKHRVTLRAFRPSVKQGILLLSAFV